MYAGPRSHGCQKQEEKKATRPMQNRPSFFAMRNLPHSFFERRNSNSTTASGFFFFLRGLPFLKTCVSSALFRYARSSSLQKRLWGSLWPPDLFLSDFKAPDLSEGEWLVVEIGASFLSPLFPKVECLFYPFNRSTRQSEKL